MISEKELAELDYAVSISKPNGVVHGILGSNYIPMLTAEIRRLREALSWYSIEGIYGLYTNPGMKLTAPIAVLEDKGQRARDALGKTNE